MSKPLDLTGFRSGRLVATKRDGANDRGQATWQCACDCGKETVVAGYLLPTFRVKSCGCLRVDRNVERAKHGAAHNPGIPEYRSWTSMRQRCDNPKNRKYPEYGGRGIRYAERWNDFAVFLADMGKRPGPGFTLDRIENDGNYEPDNCRWATATQQANNRRPRRAKEDHAVGAL